MFNSAGTGEKTPKPSALKYLHRSIGTLAVTSVAIAGIYFGEKAIMNATSDRSAVVAGVPGLVIAHKSQNDSSLLFNKIQHWLKVEQCPHNGVATKEGGSNALYGPSPALLKAGCYEDWALVTAKTATQFADGDSVVFNGSPQDHLTK